MSSVTETRNYNLDAAALTDAIAAAAASVRLKEKARTNVSIKVAEGFSLLSFSWPTSITATFKPAGAQTSVEYLAKNFGFGPIQSNHVKGVLKKLTDALADKEAK